MLNHVVRNKSMVEDIFAKSVKKQPEISNYKTMYSGYMEAGPKYANLNRFVDKVFPRDVMTNNFFNSMNKSGHGQSFIKKKAFSFY